MNRPAPHSVIRYAPSTTGHAHPGTFMAGLLCWLTARSHGSRALLRLENIDPDRSKPEYEKAMIEDLAWLGLEWDAVVYQNQNRARHEDALDQLQERGLLYPCSCSRSRLKQLGKRAPDGGHAYDNDCRKLPLPRGGWRACNESVRLRLPDESVELPDESGIIIRQHPANEMGDPIVRRRDGAIAYHLACVVDDADISAGRIIRGRDLIHSAPTQRLIQKLLQYPLPVYRHHFLLLDQKSEKLAKMHGAVGAPELKRHFTRETLCGIIAHWCGLLDVPEPCRPHELVDDFTWEKVRQPDLILKWENGSFEYQV